MTCQNGQQIITIDSNGTVTGLGMPGSDDGSLPHANRGYISGDMSSDGDTFWLNFAGGGPLYKITGLNSWAGPGNPLPSATSVPIMLDTTGDGAGNVACTAPQTGTQTFSCGRVADWAYNPVTGLLYGGDDRDGELAILNPANGVRTDLPMTDLPTVSIGYGGAWANASGSIFLYANSGEIYEIDPGDCNPFTGVDSGGAACTVTPTIVDTQTSDVIPDSLYNDAAACASGPAIELIKTANPTSVIVGGEVTYTFTVNNLSLFDTVTINSLTDNLLGDLTSTGGVINTTNCVLTQSLVPVGGATDSYTCSVTTNLTGSPDDVITNIATASGTSDGGVPVSDDDTADVTLQAVPQGTVSGHIFADLNDNGSQDGGEADLAGVNVVITDSNGDTQTVTTDANGDYTATVPAGSTTADVDENTLPTGYVDGTFTDDPTTITAIAGQDNDIGDDGYQPQGTLSGHLYEDTNGNGTQDAGEPNLANVDVIVTDSAGNTQTVTTNADGDWTAEDLAPGDYTADVDETDPDYPSGYNQTEGDDPTTTTVVAGADTDGGIDGYTTPLDLSETHVDVSCSLSGSIDLTVTGGSTPYTYEWSNGETTEDIGSLVPGDYTVTVTDNDGHTETISVTIKGLSCLSVSKLTKGAVDDTKSWQFTLYLVTDEGVEEIATDNTSGDTDGLLEFGGADLDPAETYVICESNIPAGWIGIWQVDLDDDDELDALVVPYNPDASNEPPQDLGERCVDFGADTDIPLTAAQFMHFEVDNTYPGGEPRTPGYWKNWNSCTDGGQAANAERQGGWEEGFWLIEDVLDPLVGGGVTWDDNLDHGGDIPDFTIELCEVAVDILDQRDIGNELLIGDGRKMASDAAYTLAMHLLAAQLNFGAGAVVCDEVIDAAMEAEDLLDLLDFNGTGSYLKPKNRDYDYALQLAFVLDQYNNGNLCSNELNVTLLNLEDGVTTLSGTVELMAQVTGPDPVVEVEFFVGNQSLGVDSDGSDGWSVMWDSTLSQDGDYTITAQATDQLGGIGSDSVSVTLYNGFSTGGSLHVGAMAGSSKNTGKNWSATVTVTVHDQSEGLAPNVSVSASWDDGATVVATTDSSGQAVFTLNKISKSTPSVTFSVIDAAGPGYDSYDSGDNEVTLATVGVSKP